MNLLKPRVVPSDSEPAEYQIDDTYTVPVWLRAIIISFPDALFKGVGTVVSGTMIQGVVRAGDTLLIGPDNLGAFSPQVVKSIYRKRMPAKELRAGQNGTLALKKIRRRDIRKGMVLVAPVIKPRGVWEFNTEIVVLHHPTTISIKYQVCHMSNDLIISPLTRSIAGNGAHRHDQTDRVNRGHGSRASPVWR